MSVRLGCYMFIRFRLKLHSQTHSLERVRSPAAPLCAVLPSFAHVIAATMHASSPRLFAANSTARSRAYRLSLSVSPPTLSRSPLCLPFSLFSLHCYEALRVTARRCMHFTRTKRCCVRLRHFIGVQVNSKILEHSTVRRMLAKRTALSIPIFSVSRALCELHTQFGNFYAFRISVMKWKSNLANSVSMGLYFSCDHRIS